ncbi:unnamed protein product [Candidula unifasciata]|uniref:DNA topoisomerase (ATP-hydrolyzing) n=1 Tax=Candidula unifasciata TaxID=100452 RepID=A0A8S3YLA3_9EUPU|nr:unnamed protein product [Candidula unifasciata]
MFLSTQKKLIESTQNKDILCKIEDVCLQVIISLTQNKTPELVFPRHSDWNQLKFKETVVIDTSSDNVPMTKVKLDSPQSVKKFATMLKILNIIYTLIQEDRFCTKRDIFYQYPDLYQRQSSVDLIIDDIACMLKIPRWQLHILATSKGLVAGNLQFEDAKGTQIDCQHATQGVQIAAHTKDMQNIQTQANFVLVVEKDATFQKLMSSNFCQKMAPCILITGKGFPDNGTRLMLKQLWMTFKLPIFLLVDADPHGIEIMAVYKYGSKRQAYDNIHLAVPTIEWIGILPEDIHRLHIPESALSAMSDRDLQKCVSLKRRPYFCHDETMLAQIDLLLEIKKKAEIQCLDAVSSHYLCDVYLPSRLSLVMFSTSV